MAMLPSGYVVSATGVYGNYPTEKVNGGTAIGITDATSTTVGTFTRTFPVRTAASDGIPNRRNLVVELSGVAHAYSTQKARSSGTFAYGDAPTAYVPIIRRYTATINGTATTAVLLTGNEQHRLRRGLKQKDLGAATVTAWAAGYFRWNRAVGVGASATNKRSPWSTTPTALTNTFKSTTNSSTDSDDQAIYVTYRSVPGELVYLQGPLTPYQDDYKAITG